MLKIERQASYLYFESRAYNDVAVALMFKSCPLAVQREHNTASPDPVTRPVFSNALVRIGTGQSGETGLAWLSAGLE